MSLTFVKCNGGKNLLMTFPVYKYIYLNNYMILRDWGEGGGFRGRRRGRWSRSRVNWGRGEAGPARDLLTRS